jgi:hypothetical protein
MIEATKIVDNKRNGIAVEYRAFIAKTSLIDLIRILLSNTKTNN